MKILLAEDEATIAFTLTDDLEAAGHGVVHVDDGLRALELLERQPFDCVITDLRLRSAAGSRIVAAARTVVPEATIIVISACFRASDPRELARLGADACVAKPFFNDRLIADMESLAARRRRRA